MTRDEISTRIRAAYTLAECRETAEDLRDYLQANPGDDDVRDEGSSLYMKLTALEQAQSALRQSVPPPAQRVA